MIFRNVVLIFSFLYFSGTIFSQEVDSLSIMVSSKMESLELQDYYNFKGINYFTIAIEGERIKDNYYLITADTYWDNEVTSIDTLINSKRFRRKNNKNEIQFRTISQKEMVDSVAFQIYLPRGAIKKEFKTIDSNMYQLRSLSNGKSTKFAFDENIPIFVYSLPYVNPKRPNIYRYCKLTKDGIPPEKWGEEFNIDHYIIFRIKIIE